ncbi:hypothetical protein BDV41DRAFT_570049 [Aspergillus transmontanensis]|uniref:Uncharacterized protein n=1 Tax=Aspergillus transmontanensis TaxID=1034304 RepID=A0A5N6VD21_9EURO|nr:hypothetical protein BDV41DRAFT_570049 [Aspergillus transmontanensis]
MAAAISLWVMQTSPWKSHLPTLKSSGFIRMEITASITTTSGITFDGIKSFEINNGSRLPVSKPCNVALDNPLLS